MQYALKYNRPRICQNAPLSQIFTAEVLVQFLLQLKKITESISFDQIARQLALLFFYFHFSLHPTVYIPFSVHFFNPKLCSGSVWLITSTAQSLRLLEVSMLAPNLFVCISTVYRDSSSVEWLRCRVFCRVCHTGVQWMWSGCHNLQQSILQSGGHSCI